MPGWHDPNEDAALTEDIFGLIDATAKLVAGKVTGRYVEDYGAPDCGMPKHVALMLELHEECMESLSPDDDELPFKNEHGEPEPLYIPSFAVGAWRNCILSEWVFCE